METAHQDRGAPKTGNFFEAFRKYGHKWSTHYRRRNLAPGEIIVTVGVFVPLVHLPVVGWFLTLFAP